MTETCGILMPFRDFSYMNDDEDFPPCLRPMNHEGEHLMHTSDGRFIAWSFDEEYCGDADTCICISDDGLIECFSGGEVSPEEAAKMIEESLAK